MKRLILALLLLSLPVWSQDSMSLADAVRLALTGNKSIVASGASQKAAAAKVSEARSGYLPKLNYTESWTRSDNPVFVFSSLLTQHQFELSNFQIGPLNRPDFLNNFQSLVTADQTIYDAGETRHAVRSAEIVKKISGEDDRRTRMDVIGAVIRSYYGVLLGTEQVRVAEQSVRSAEADLDRAKSMRDAGMATDVDVLSIQVHLSGVREQQIQRAAELDVARAALNQALGMQLDQGHTLTTALAALPEAASSVQQYEKTALAERPEARQLRLATNLAENEASAARGRYLPQVTFHAAFEADRQNFYDKGGANWLASVGLKWNLFNGLGDKARIEESDMFVRRSAAVQDHTGDSIRLQVRRAYADLTSARQRIDVATASVAEAEESLRITKNRYDAGMSNVTDLLRTETALLEVRTRLLSAIHDERLAAAGLEMAAGTLTPDSEVLK